MPNPIPWTDDAADVLDTLFLPDNTPLLKAGGRVIPTTDGASVDTAPHLVEDATLLSGTGHAVVAAGPARSRLASSSTPCRRITVKADTSNTHTLYLGTSVVTADTTATTGGLQLGPGEFFTFGADDVHDVYIHGTVGEGCSFAYEL